MSHLSFPAVPAVASLLTVAMISFGPSPGLAQGSEPSPQPSPSQADVIEVKVQGQPQAYQFSVTLKSPDTGCDHYADWWEVITPAGQLLYRRVLLHSHIEEQPFTRSGGPVPAAPDQEIIVRAHMNSTGYGGQVLRGDVAQGFKPADLASEFAADLATQDPLPQNCAF